MKKRINIIFFSICFLASLMAEAYCFLILDGEPISVIGIGIVVLIVCYLLLDTIRGEWNQSKQRTKFQLEQLYQKEAKKLEYKYTELLNLHKASYTAAKKNTLMLNEKFDVLNVRLCTMEKSNEIALKKISELQKKALEGQKNALNIEVNYNKENTKLLVKAFREECSKLDQNDQLALIASLLKQNQGLLKESQVEFRKDTEDNQTSEEFEFKPDYMDFDQDMDITDISNMDISNMDISNMDISNMNKSNIDITNISNISDVSNIETSIDDPMETALEDASETSESMDTDFTTLIPTDYEAELHNLISNTSKEELNEEEEALSEDALNVDVLNEEVSQEIKPLYDDPNKALTADEIAALFATYGK